MFFRLFLLFTTIPLLELWLLLELGKIMGPVPTIALVIGTGILGAALAKSEGLRTFRRVQEDLATGRLPKDAMLDGLLILIAGAVLLTPGILTDFLGFFLLIPWGRALVRVLIVSRMSLSFTQNVQFHSSSPFSPPSSSEQGAPQQGQGPQAERRRPPPGQIVIDVEPPSDS